MAAPRLQTAGEAANTRPNQKADSPCLDCSGSCAEAWASVDREVRVATAPLTAEVRNRNISAAYAEMNLRRPDMQWIGLAAVVSRQAGCAMEDADRSMANPVSIGPAMIAKSALAETNLLIFTDIYPVMRFYERFGIDALKRCRAARQPPGDVPKELMRAVEDQEAARKGDARKMKDAADEIARYEQIEIVQARIYNKPAYKAVFTLNEKVAPYSIGRWFGARPAEVALSSRCADTPPVPLKGSISSADDRVGYYMSLRDQFERNGDEWRRTTMDAIVQQRKGTGGQGPSRREIVKPVP